MCQDGRFFAFGGDMLCGGMALYDQFRYNSGECNSANDLGLENSSDAFNHDCPDHFERYHLCDWICVGVDDWWGITRSARERERGRDDIGIVTYE